MENLIGILIPRKQLDEDMELDQTALYAPITVGDKPIGFISGMNDVFITACIWTRNWNVIFNDEGALMSVEIDDKGEHYDETGIYQ